MKRNLLIGICIILLSTGSYGQVAINETGASPDSSAILDISSTNKGLLIPRVTTAERNAIGTTQTGLLVYDTDTESFWYFDNTQAIWVEIVVEGNLDIDGLSDAKADARSVFLGNHSGDNDDGSNFNTAVGISSLQSNTSGNNNVSVGFGASVNTTSGSSNTSIGYYSSRLNTEGEKNTAIGAYANYTNQTGSNNTIIGFQAGRGINAHSKSGNVFLGYMAGYNETGDNKLYIENSDTSNPLIYGDFSNDVLGFMGNVGIGTKTPEKNLHVVGSDTLASLLITPDETNNGDDSELLFGEDKDYTYGMSIKYDGGANKLFFYGKNDALVYGPHLTIERTGNIGIGTDSPTEAFQVVTTTDKCTAYFTGEGLGVDDATVYSYNTNTSLGTAGYFKTVGTGATVILKQQGAGYFMKAYGPNDGNVEWEVRNNGYMTFYNSDHNKTIEIDPSETGTNDAGQITLYAANGTTKTIEIDGGYNGDGRITTNELQITGGSDLSEFFELSDYNKIEKGMVVSIDENNPGQLRVCNEAFDKKVAGIVSGANSINPGLIMSQKGTIADGEHLIALSGRVYCMVDATENPIEIGDMLTTSSTPGHAMKVDDYQKAQGAIIGKAMTSLKSGKGLVLVLVSLQ